MNLARTTMATIALACFAMACSAASTGEKDDANTTIQPLEAPEMSLPMPEHTRAIVRVHPQRFGEFLEAVNARARAAGAPGMAAVDRPEALVAFAALSPASSRPGMLKQLLTADEEDYQELAKHFSSVDGSRPILLAVSTRGNEGLLNRLRYGLPVYTDWQDYPAGLSRRVFIPVTDPEEFRSDLDDIRSELRLSEDAIRRFDSRAGYVAIDIHQRTAQEQLSEDPFVVDWGANEEGYWSRDTPALRAFLQRDSAISIYARGADLPPMGALSGMVQAAEALGSATPQNRRAMYARGSSLASQLFFMESPESREFEDMTVAIVANDDHELVADLYRSHTEYGARIAEAARLDVELPSIRVDAPKIDFEWARDGHAARGQAIQPTWMQAFDGDGGPGKDLAALLRATGFWGYAVAMLNYPQGFGSGLAQLGSEALMPGFSPLNQGSDLYALRVRLGLADDSSQPLAARLRGGLVVLVHQDSDLTRQLENFIEQIQSVMPVEASINKEPSNDKTLVRVALGPDDALFGEPEPVASFSTRLRLEQLEQLTRRQLPMRRAGQFAAALTLLKGAGELQIEDASSRQATALRVRLGAGDTQPLSVPRSTVPLADPQRPVGCSSGVATASRQMLDQLDRNDPAELPAFFDRVNERLDAAESECAKIDAPSRETLDWMRVSWQSYEGRYWAEQMQWGSALELLDDACDAGNSRACTDRDKTRDYQQRLRFAQVAAASTKLEAMPARPAVATRGGLSQWSMGMIDAMYGEQTIEFDQLVSAHTDPLHDVFHRLVVRTIEPRGHGPISAVILPIDQLLSSATARALVQVAHKKDVESERRRAKYRNEKPPKGAAATGFVAALEGEPGLGLLVFRSASDDARPDRPPIVVTVSDDGLTIGHEEGETMQLNGCPPKDEDGCRIDAEKASDHIDRLLNGDSDADQSAQRLAEIVQWYGVDKLPEKLDAMDLSADGLHVVIRAEAEVPFGLLAQLHGSLNAWASQTDPSGAVPFVVLD